MEASILREKLHELIDNSSEDKLMEVFNVFEDNYTNEFKTQLDEEYADYEKNGKVISKKEIDGVIEQLLFGK